MYGENMREEYIITQENRNYHFTMEMIDRDLVRVHCREEGGPLGEFVGDFSFQDLRNMSNIMNDFRDMEEAILEMDDCLVRHRTQVINQEDHCEVDVFMDTNGRNETIPFDLEWHGDCRSHQSVHNPEKIMGFEKDNERIRREQDSLRERINNCFQSQQHPSNYSSFDRPIPEDEVLRSQNYNYRRNNY